jgi:uncharacterized membrane protein (UPF0127 family)
MIRRVLLAVGIAVLLACAAVVFVAVERAEAPAPVPASAEPLPGTIEVVDTPEARERGLSGREVIPDDYGMLFVFEMADEYGFWMKDMQVPIDIVWIDDDGQVVYIQHELSPDTYPAIYAPPVPARYVLETRAGYVRERGWEAGTRLDLGVYRK